MPEIVFPKNNEKEFLDIAEKLGIKEIYFIYPFGKDLKKIKDTLPKSKIKIRLGFFALAKDIQKAKNKSDFVISNSSEKDQFVFEKLRPNLVFDLEFSPKKDPTHFRRSGLNQVLCKLANKNNIVIGFSFKSLLDAKDKPLILGRIMQNVRFCKKYKVKTLFASFSSSPFDMRSEKDYKSLFSILQ